MLRTAALVVFIVCNGALLLTGGAAAQRPALTSEQRAELERWWDSQPKVTLPFDSSGARVFIVEFTDLQCPHCRQKYLEIKPILEKYAGRPKDVTLLLKHWPISSTCNPGASSNMHPAACDAAAAVVMARPKRTADTLVDWFFLHQAELTPAVVRSAAAEVGTVADFDVQYAKALQEVKTDAALGSSLGVSSTPSFFVNGRRIPGGGLAPQYFEALVELELRRAK